MKKLLLGIAGTALMMGMVAFTPKNHDTTLTVNVEKSRIDWSGAKKNDFHTGYFPLKSGQIIVDGGKLKGGSFVIDLANLKVTDAAGDRLTGHLKGADFFDVAKFGEATYQITGVNYSSATACEISGNLTVKGAVVPVKFNANIRNADDKGFFAEGFFSIDKNLVGIAYGAGNISDDVQVAVHVFAK